MKYFYRTEILKLNKAASFLGKVKGKILHDLIENKILSLPNNSILVLDLAKGKRPIDYNFFSTSIAPIIRNFEQFGNRYLVYDIGSKYTTKNSLKWNILSGILMHIEGKTVHNEAKIKKLIKKNKIYLIFKSGENLIYIGDLRKKLINYLTKSKNLNIKNLNRIFGIQHSKLLDYLKFLNDKRIIYKIPNKLSYISISHLLKTLKKKEV